MEDSFSVRVGKVFGSLSSSSSLTPSSLWSLTDEEVEKKEWNRDLHRSNDDERLPSTFNGRAAPASAACFLSKSLTVEASSSSSSNLSAELHADLQSLYDDDDEDEDDELQERRKKKKDKKIRHRDDDELDVRSSIGLDSTLDYEEEEDEFDKIAEGKEKGGRELLYTKYVSDYDGELPDNGSLGSSVTRDPRANHLVAKLRLKEDSEAAGDFHSLNLSDQNTTTNLLPDNAAAAAAADAPTAPKPILKKRQTHQHAKSPKRVRFDPRFSNQVAEYISFPAPAPPPRNGEGDENDDATRPQVPGYLRNPSKYTRYSFDSGNMDDESNRGAYMDFLNLIKKQTSAAADANEPADDSSKPPIFTPRKPPTLSRENQVIDASQDKNTRVTIAAEDDDDAQDTEVSAMEEDEPDEQTTNRNVHKPGRQYGARRMVDSEEQQQAS